MTAEVAILNRSAVALVRTVQLRLPFRLVKKFPRLEINLLPYHSIVQSVL
jgi:hypothetical protein